VEETKISILRLKNGIVPNVIHLIKFLQQTYQKYLEMEDPI